MSDNIDVLSALKETNRKLQIIIDNQDRDYKAARDWEQYCREVDKKEDKEHEQQVKEMQNRVSSIFGGIDMKGIMEMAQKQMGDMFDDKKSFDSSILRKKPRKYDDSDQDNAAGVNVSKDGEISP